MALQTRMATKRERDSANGGKSTVEAMSSMIVKCPCTTGEEHYFKIMITPCEKATPAKKERRALKGSRLVSEKGKPIVKSESTCKKGKSSKRKRTTSENGKPAKRKRIPSTAATVPANRRAVKRPSKTERAVKKVSYMKVGCPGTTGGEHYFKIVIIPCMKPTSNARGRNSLQIMDNPLKNGATTMKNGSFCKKGGPTKTKNGRKVSSTAEEPTTSTGGPTKRNAYPSENRRCTKGRGKSSERGRSLSETDNPQFSKDVSPYSTHVCPLSNGLCPHWGAFSFPYLYCPVWMR
jgi:hypothetical protein